MISFEEEKSKPGSFKRVCNSIHNLLNILKDHKNLVDFFDGSKNKNENNFIEYQHKESVVERVLYRDRTHPVDTVILNNFYHKTGSDLKSVKMEYGPSSDEYTRSHHALAIAVADTIYFRNGAYRPETEDGRKLIAHELTHIAQNKEKEDYRNVTKEEKETEAETVEEQEVYNPDKIIKKKIGGKEYRLKESVWKQIEKEARRRLEKKIDEMENKMPDEDYLKLLTMFEKWEQQKNGNNNKSQNCQ